MFCRRRASYGDGRSGHMPEGGRTSAPRYRGLGAARQWIGGPDSELDGVDRTLRLGCAALGHALRPPGARPYSPPSDSSAIGRSNIYHQSTRKLLAAYIDTDDLHGTSTHKDATATQLIFVQTPYPPRDSGPRYPARQAPPLGQEARARPQRWGSRKPSCDTRPRPPRHLARQSGRPSRDASRSQPPAP